MDGVREALKAIETAIQIEKDGIVFYTRVAERIENPEGKKMFRTLAADEKAHLELFTKVKESLLQENRWLTPDEIRERPLEVLKKGIEMEEASIKFYTEAMEGTDDPQAREMYRYLIEQEEGHRTILQGEYDYIAGTGFWFDFREFDLEAAG